MTDLATLFSMYGSDKNMNGYSSLYTTLFWHLKLSPVTFLEIGIGTMIPGAASSMHGYMPDSYTPGASLRAWRDFFPFGSIHGMDIQQDCMIEEDRITTHLCNSTDYYATHNWVQERPDLLFDVIIDDASHWETHQLATLANLWPRVKMGGFYIIEDVPIGSLISRAPEKVHEIVGDVSIFFSGLKSNLCVIHKVPLQCAREY
jgi:hypothetical protein